MYWPLQQFDVPHIVSHGRSGVAHFPQVAFHALAAGLKMETCLMVTSACLQVDDCLKAVRDAVATIWPHASTEAFGSQAAGLAMPGSDLDLVVLGLVDEILVTTPEDTR